MHYHLSSLLLQDIHKELEGKISQFHGHEDTVLYASCFDANAGLFEALLTEEDALFSDQLNHASIIDGVRLAKTNKHRYTHRSMYLRTFISLSKTASVLVPFTPELDYNYMKTEQLMYTYMSMPQCLYTSSLPQTCLS